MSHHGDKPELSKRFEEFLKTVPRSSGLKESPLGNTGNCTPIFGATGKFPNGKLNENDEGEIRIGIRADSNGIVTMNFGKPTAWIGFTKKQAYQIGELLIKDALPTDVKSELDFLREIWDSLSKSKHALGMELLLNEISLRIAYLLQFSAEGDK